MWRDTHRKVTVRELNHAVADANTVRPIVDLRHIGLAG